MNSLNCLSKECINLLDKNNMLLALIESEVKRHELSTVKIEKELKTKLLNDLIKKVGLTDLESFNKWVKDNKINKEKLEESTLNDLKIKRYCKKKFELKAESRFLERKSNLDIIVYSMIRVKETAKAREIYLRITEDKEDFGDLATQFSEGIEKRTRGIIGPAPLGAAHPILIEHLKDKKAGEVQPPIFIDNYHIIVRIESYEPAKLDNFMREKMSEELFNNWIKAEAKKISITLLDQIESSQVQQ